MADDQVETGLDQRLDNLSGKKSRQRLDFLCPHFRFLGPIMSAILIGFCKYDRVQEKNNSILGPDPDPNSPM